jgi:hypothetical protein
MHVSASGPAGHRAVAMPTWFWATREISLNCSQTLIKGQILTLRKGGDVSAVFGGIHA